MELRDLMECIINEKPPQFIIMFGEEQKVADIYIDKIEELGYNRKILETVSDAVSKCSTKQLGKSKNVYLVNEDKDFMKSEKSWDKVKSIVSSTDNILIVRYVKINKTTKFYKRNKDVTVEFPKLDSSILSNYIKKELSDLTDENCVILAEACSNDYGRILLEIDKVKHYKEAISSQDSNTAFLDLYNSNAIYSDIGDITFALTNAIAVGDIENAFSLLDKAKSSGEPALRICSILYTNFKNQLSIMCLGANKQNLAARTGIDSRVAYMVLKQSGAYSIKECIRNVNICQSVEIGIKQGRIDADIALDYLVTSVLF